MKIINKKRLAVLLASALLLVVAVGGTIAFLVASTDPLVNTFTPASVNVTVTDNVSGNVKNNVVITNTGTTSAYIRARIVGSWVDKDGVTVAMWDSSQGTFDPSRMPGSGWTEDGDYYYHIQPVIPGATTAPLFNTYTPPTPPPKEGAHLVLDILVQAIQSEGGAAQNAWGVDPSTLE